jgi:hypothetical protein
MIQIMDYLAGAKYRPFIKANHPRGLGAGENGQKFYFIEETIKNGE